jgi:hypothetical protein
VVKPLAAALTSFVEALSSRAEHRCKRFDVVKPLAAALKAFVETLSSRGEHRCKRFDVVKPLAAALKAFVEALFSRGEHRCKRFDVAEPLAAAREALWAVRAPFDEVRPSPRVSLQRSQDERIIVHGARRVERRGCFGSIRRRAARQPGLDLDHLRVGHTVREGGR